MLISNLANLVFTFGRLQALSRPLRALTVRDERDRKAKRGRGDPAVGVVLALGKRVAPCLAVSSEPGVHEHELRSGVDDLDALESWPLASAGVRNHRDAASRRIREAGRSSRRMPAQHRQGAARRRRIREHRRRRTVPPRQAALQRPAFHEPMVRRLRTRQQVPRGGDNLCRRDGVLRRNEMSPWQRRPQCASLGLSAPGAEERRRVQVGRPRRNADSDQIVHGAQYGPSAGPSAFAHFHHVINDFLCRREGDPFA